MSSTDLASPRPEVSVVIPCFNEEDNVRQIHAAVTRELEAHASSHEIVFIDNASSDATQHLMRQICAGDARTRAIVNNRNYGQMRSPTYAIYQAEGDCVIGMCADFQDPPSLIGPMIAQWRAGAQVVMGQRRTERSSALSRAARKFGYGFLGAQGDYAVLRDVTGFGLFDRACVDALAAWHEPEPFFRGMVVESGFRIALIPFDRPERERGATKNDFWTLLDFAISGLAGSAKSLLRLPIMLSIFAAMIAVVLLVATIVAASLGASLAWVFGFIAGQLLLLAVILLFLGLIGEQVRVISERTRNVPLVIEDERINFPLDRQRPAARTFVRS